MFWGSIDWLTATAVAIVETQYPKEFHDRKYSDTIYDLIDIVGEELAAKNGNLFITPFLSRLADSKDISYGDTARFIVDDK